MIYPQHFENKIGFTEIRALIKSRCLSTLGKERVDELVFCTDVETIQTWFNQIREFKLLQADKDEFPIQYFFDVRSAIYRLRLEGTHLDEAELFDLKRSLTTITQMIQFLNKTVSDATHSDNVAYIYPNLRELTRKLTTFPQLLSRIDNILDKFGRIKDNASPELLAIRSELSKLSNSISRTLHQILRNAQSEGVVEKDITPTLRDGRLVIPVSPAAKRKISGIVHDESATGRTVYIEPSVVVEANNRIRELENAERREIIRILTEFSQFIRPHVEELLACYRFMGEIDFIRAKTLFAENFGGIEPVIAKEPLIDWQQAIHPLLHQSLQKQGKEVVPLNIQLAKQQRILVISGPNAGGKSVCLKTVGLLQYMLQCGVSVPMNEHSKCGLFHDILIDIGDEQSIENDLSTYSSHLTNMKQMMLTANANSLLLIDEFGAGTEPGIGGAIAEAVLQRFCEKKTFAIINTHYQNLKRFADSHEMVVNGAMLYDRHRMVPLFQLSIGQPGSSFAIDIARKTGLPEEVIKYATDLVGTDYVQSDKYLQDIVRDKLYWENKRKNIHHREKDLEKVITKYAGSLDEVEAQRKEILGKARKQAEELLQEANKKIEHAIKEIRLAQAEKEETKRIREELDVFKEEVKQLDTTVSDELIAKKMEQIKNRKARKGQRKQHQQLAEEKAIAHLRKIAQTHEKNEEKVLPQVGDPVRIKGLASVGELLAIEGNMAVVLMGGMRTRMKLERLEKAQAKASTTVLEQRQADAVKVSRITRDTIDDRRKSFKQDLDIRGMRGDEALNAVQYFIDDAIMVGMSRVRILHGKGNGILRQLIRDYLSGVPNITHYADEHVQFGGSGITVVDF